MKSSIREVHTFAFIDSRVIYKIKKSKSIWLMKNTFKFY